MSKSQITIAIVGTLLVGCFASLIYQHQMMKEMEDEISYKERKIRELENQVSSLSVSLDEAIEDLKRCRFDYNRSQSNYYNSEQKRQSLETEKFFNKKSIFDE